MKLFIFSVPGLMDYLYVKAATIEEALIFGREGTLPSLAAKMEIREVTSFEEFLKDCPRRFFVTTDTYF